ncbi:MAG: hypothetical protein OCC49_09730 [Fibrobacterales bacterium]
MKKALLVIASTLVIFTGCLTSDDSGSTTAETNTNPELVAAQAELDSVKAELDSAKIELEEVKEDYDDAVEDDADCETSECQEAKTALDTKQSEVTEAEAKVDTQEKEVKDTEEKIAEEQKAAVEAAQNSASYSNSFNFYEENAIESYNDEVLITLEISDDCEEEEVTYKYILDDDELIIETEECERITYTGSSETVVGYWTFKSWEFDSSITFGCDEDAANAFKDTGNSGSMTITEQKMIIDQTIAYNCLIDITTTDGDFAGVDMEKVDCNTVRDSHKGFESEVRIDVSQGVMSVKMSQSYDGTSCEVEMTTSMEQFESIEACKDEETEMESQAGELVCMMRLNQAFCKDFPDDQMCSDELDIDNSGGDGDSDGDNGTNNTTTDPDDTYTFPSEKQGNESASCDFGMYCATYLNISSEYKQAMEAQCTGTNSAVTSCPASSTACETQTILGSLSMQMYVPVNSTFTCEMILESMEEN